MWTCIVENKKGEQLRLTQNENYIVEIPSGLLPSSADVNLSKSSGQNGYSYNSSTSDKRNLLIKIYPQFPVDKNRINLYKYFKKNEPIKVYYKNAQRNVFIEGYVETPEGNLHEMQQAITYSIVCPDPYWKSLSEIEEDISKLSALFEFPFSIDAEGIPFSEFNEYLIAQITNEGDVSTGITIELYATGTVVNPVIYNADTREKFMLDFTMLTSDKIIINTNEIDQSIQLIRNGITSNIINNVVDYSDWLQCDTGVNFYTYTADSGLDDLQIKFKTRYSFEGV